MRSSPRQLSIDAALDLALEDGRAPITIADTADNTGGGAPGDSTFFLDALIRRRIGGAALGPLYDPIAVGICQDGGVGARLRLRIGGKLGARVGRSARRRLHGHRLVESRRADAEWRTFEPRRVRRRAHSHRRRRSRTGIEVMLTTRRVQAGSPELFTGVGIDPHAKRFLVVKSTQHFHAGFAPISARVIYTGDRGALIADPRDIPYRRVRTSDYWPFTATPDFGD